VTSWSQIARRIRVPAGFVLAVVYLLLAMPNWRSIALGSVFVLAGLIIRGFASGHLQKNEQLATSGPYAYTRNPLYFGSLVMAVGFAIAAKSVWIAFLLAAIFVLIYLPVIRAEESYLGQQFPEFAEYARQVPRLIPRARAHQSNSGSFSWALYNKHREYNAVLGALAILAALVGKMMWAH